MVKEPTNGDTAVSDYPPPSSEDRDLTIAFQRGEKGAYQAIYDRHAPRVRSVCHRMLNHPEDAKEAAQEAFLRVYQSLGRFNGEYQLGAWIVRITTNVCLDHLRAGKRRPSDPTPIEDLIYAASGPPDVTDPAWMAVQAAHDRRVLRQVAALPPRHRDALILRDLEGHSYAEVAHKLDLSEGQTKALIHRARKGFRRAWLSTGPSSEVTEH